MLFSSEKTLFEKLNVTDLSIYTGDSSVENYQTSLSGNGYLFTCSTQDFRSLNCNIDGISFQTNLTPDQIFSRLNIQIQSTQNLNSNGNEVITYYCFLENLYDNVIIDGKKINLQIAFDGEKTTIGLPLILGSY
jgi:hypothetical protein